MTKTASSRRTILFSIIPFIIILLILFIVMWVPLLGTVYECGNVLSGKSSSSNKALSSYAFENDHVAEDDGVEKIIGWPHFIWLWHSREKGVIIVLNNRLYFDSAGNRLAGSILLDPVRIELEKVNGSWQIVKMYNLVP